MRESLSFKKPQVLEKMGKLFGKKACTVLAK
jgi:hypothetical protein